MKYIIAFLLACVVQVGFAQTSLYGRIYPEMDIRYTKITDKKTGEVFKQTSRPRLGDDGSRLGIRSKYAINETSDVIYRVEWRTPFDDERRNFELRDAYFGINHKKYGTIKAGRLTTPDSYLGYAPLPTDVDGFRANNSLRYESPLINNTRLMAQYIMDENNDSDSLDTDGYAILVDYEKEQYGMGLAFMSANAKKSLHGVKIKNAVRMAGYYKITPDVEIGTLYQQNKFTDSPITEKGISVQLAHENKDTQLKHYVYYYHTDNYHDGGDIGTQSVIGIGADKRLTKNMGVGAELEYTKLDFESEKIAQLGLSLSASYRF